MIGFAFCIAVITLCVVASAKQFRWQAGLAVCFIGMLVAGQPSLAQEQSQAESQTESQGAAPTEDLHSLLPTNELWIGDLDGMVRPRSPSSAVSGASVSRSK